MAGTPPINASRLIRNPSGTGEQQESGSGSGSPSISAHPTLKRDRDQKEHISGRRGSANDDLMLPQVPNSRRGSFAKPIGTSDGNYQIDIFDLSAMDINSN
ncbi:hypothetical protein HDU76_007217, partial [Blyttiomyces sp. JEL0837]